MQVEVHAYRRLSRRRRYRPTCVCATHPELLVAPPPPPLLANRALGVSVWGRVLWDKYASYRPTQRLLADLRLHGLDLAAGTITAGASRLLPLLAPLYEARRARNQQQTHGHGDETRWQVFASVQGKAGSCWYLWLVLSAAVAVFVLAAGRSPDVPEPMLGDDARGSFNADRYWAYPALKQVKEGQVPLAWCWAHQRGAFSQAQRCRPEVHDGAAAWRRRLAALYRLNETRRGGWPKDAAAFAQTDQSLRQAVAAMAQAAQQERAPVGLPPPCRQVLENLDVSWAGRRVFVDHPAVPLANHAAEDADRGPLVGRKNYYGRGAVWAGPLAALLFSVFQTRRLGGLNGRQWWTDYLTACVATGGQALPELRRGRPWTMTEAQGAERKVSGQAQARRAQDSSQVGQPQRQYEQARRPW